MAVPNPWSITFGAFSAGGTSDTYLLNGPYVIERSADNIRLVFAVTVVASSYSELLSLSETLEQSCSARDIGFSVFIDGEEQVFFVGTDLLNPTASVSKRGDIESDRGFSRDYTVTIEAGLAASDLAGLRDISFTVVTNPSKRRVLSVRGLYTATGASALDSYQTDADGRINPVLTSLGGTWELIDEDYTQDRNDHLLQFTRNYQEIIYPESQSPDNSILKDTKINFIKLQEAPGDSQQALLRASRVVARIETWVDENAGQILIGAGQNLTNGDALQTVWEKIARPYLLQQFSANFTPQVFAVEDERVTLDRSDSRLSATVQIFYQREQGDAIMEVAASITYQEQRQIDYTYVHAKSESFNQLAAFADPGFVAVFRTSARTVRVFGDETPYLRVVREEKEDGLAGPFTFVIAKNKVKDDGWNIIDNTSSITPEYIGLPGGEQVRVTTLSETVVERYNIKPAGTVSGGAKLEPPIVTLGTKPNTGEPTGGGGSIPGSTGGGAGGEPSGGGGG